VRIVRHSGFEIGKLAVSIAAIATSVSPACAAPATMTLTCKGATTSYQTKQPDPISLGLIVDLSKKTIKGFPFPGDVEITQVTEVHVLFRATMGNMVLDGAIDRITGDVEGYSAVYKSLLTTEMLKPGNVTGGYNFALKCKPTQRVL
jgi:hypothetical protein